MCSMKVRTERRNGGGRRRSRSRGEQRMCGQKSAFAFWLFLDLLLLLHVLAHPLQENRRKSSLFSHSHREITTQLKTQASTKSSHTFTAVDIYKACGMQTDLPKQPSRIYRWVNSILHYSDVHAGLFVCNLINTEIAADTRRRFASAELCVLLHEPDNLARGGFFTRVCLGAWETRVAVSLE